MPVEHVYGTMVTMTTYGTWLRGDERGWTSDGLIWPADPILEAADRDRMLHPPFVFDPDRLYGIGAEIGKSLMTRQHQRILALTVQTWHVHFVVAESDVHISDVVKCAKEAVRYHLRAGRPIWTDDADKRFCFDKISLRNRIHYVERHNTECGLPPRPWPFVIGYEE
uniref:Transposase IS200-like domain-containing protein n=1 Tax=Schlesneria paludicola TaxID=360056 RepID=A0A7C2K0D3_9PLAN